MAKVESVRTRMLDRLVNICKAERGGAYYVRRGPINWAEFPWHRHSQAISILTPEFTILQPVRQQMNVTMDLVQKMPMESMIMDSETEETHGFDDNEIEGLVFDGEQILRQFMESTDPLFPSDTLVLNLDLLNVDVTEMTNTDFSIQGIMISFTVQY